MTNEPLGRVGLIARFKPLHNGAALLLDNACRQAQHVVVGIGSANKYNLRNPFTLEETTQMLHAYLRPRYSNYEIITIDDFGHIPEYANGQKWKDNAIQQFGELDTFLTTNPYVATLLEDTYNIVHSASIIPREDWIKIRATEVRVNIAGCRPWQHLVPREIANYIVSNSLDDRFRTEFGKQTLAEYTDYTRAESLHEEASHARES